MFPKKSFFITERKKYQFSTRGSYFFWRENRPVAFLNIFLLLKTTDFIQSLQLETFHLQKLSIQLII